MPAAPLTAISITTAARADLRRFQAIAGGVLGRRLNMSDALQLAAQIATTHLSEEATRAATALGLVTEPNGEAL